MGKSGSAAVKSFDIPKALVWQAYYPLLQRINTYLMRWAGQEIQAAAQLSPAYTRGGSGSSDTTPRCSHTGDGCAPFAVAELR